MKSLQSKFSASKRGDQLATLFPAEITRILPIGGAVPVLVYAEAGQYSALVGVVGGEFMRSRGDRRLIQPSTVLLPAVRSKFHR